MHGEGVDDARMRRALELEDRAAEAPALLRPSMQNVVILDRAGRLDEARQDGLAFWAHLRERGEETQVIVAAFYSASVESYRETSTTPLTSQKTRWNGLCKWAGISRKYSR